MKSEDSFVYLLLCFTLFRLFLLNSLMEEESQLPKWEGKTSAELKGPAAEEVWPLLADFCNIHKWFQSLETSYHVEGVPGQPGLVRYCGHRDHDDDEDDQTSDTIKFSAKEKLLMIDPVRRCLSYEILDNNWGLKSYVATMQVLDLDGNNDQSRRGCKIEWSFVCDPIEGWRFGDYVSLLDSCLLSMAKKMEHDAFPSTTS
ncbi:putative polyketide cyclase/dehydrase, START-like domain-containing protein [Rosa chinensis]|uniref:Putative polyketide cyclase/dehydrase, START-like domain-containing protein n=2 Tax=Rosa chinensis TaxID=74649 RepID=A0A2P6SIE9_ROSCH|nr:putative polyketide cyclase/dehydrase, START-like domain-containing protein [Rosa chinensis]